MSIFELKDVKTTPDPFHVYESSIRDACMPLIIDNGSYQCRVGWACNPEPLLQFRNLIAKPRKDRVRKDGEAPVTPPIQIGNDIVNIEAMRFQLKTQFDRNVVTHYHNQEQIFDYIFRHLNVEGNGGGLEHPVVLTECFANPNYSRQLMSELLFECYNVPAVTYGIDALFSFNYNRRGAQSQDALIISFGYHTTHVIPVLNGAIAADRVRRINLGGYHMITYMHRLMQLKYPVHTTAVTLSRIEWLLHQHCSVAVDYMESLRQWSSIEFYEQNVKRIQLSFTIPTASTTLTAEQKFERKRELAKRLADINARKREEKLIEDEEQLQKLMVVRELYEDDDDFEQFSNALHELEIPNIDELEKLIQTTVAKIDKAKLKIAAVESATGPQHFPFEEKPAVQIPQPPYDISIAEWLAQTKQRRTTILERRHVRRQRKNDLAKRRTAAAQERMRIISQLARKEKGTDDFGKRDEDWDVYKVISKETGDSDSDAENEKLLECEEVLRHHDPDYEELVLPHVGGAAESYQLHVGVEAIRGPELLFQPSMIGSSEAGLTETIEFVLKMFSATDQLNLANNIFLTGGCANFPGLHDRLSREMLEMRPFQTPHKIYAAAHPNGDAWQGARQFATSTDLMQCMITKQDYTEKGGEYFIEHTASNLYFPTPAPIVMDAIE